MRSTARYEWTALHIVAAVALMAVGVLLTRDAWADILHIALRDEESSQVWLVLPVAAWLVWVRRGRLRKCRPSGTLLGPAIIGVGWLLSRIGYFYAVQAAWHLGAVLVPLGAMLSVVGHDLVRRFLPAMLVLVFLVPVPGRIRSQIATPLMTATARATEEVSNILGVAVDRSGNSLSINDKNVNVVEACNGLRMVFSLLLVSYAFAFGEPLRHYVRLLILLASPLSAVVCNVVRLVPTLWMFGYGDQLAQSLHLPRSNDETYQEMGTRLANGFHDIAGWVMLVVGFLLLMAIIRILRWTMLPIRHYTLASE